MTNETQIDVRGLFDNTLENPDKRPRRQTRPPEQEQHPETEGPKTPRKEEQHPEHPESPRIPGAISEEDMLYFLQDRDNILRQLDRYDAESSLINYIKLMWRVLEPARDFVDGWAVRAICEHLEAVTSGEIIKLLINVPPGCMKSLTTNVFWPSWEWGPKNMPHMRYVSASYSDALTVRDNRRTRNLLTDDVYQQLWGDRFKLSGDQNAKVKFENNKTGFKIATSVSGLGTGERGDRFIVDDPHNVKDGESEAKREDALMWFSEVVPTRINDAEKSARVVIMQRVHERDVSGLIISKELDYERLVLPMEFEQERKCYTSIGFSDPRTEDGELLWPERFSANYLENDLKPSMRAWGGTYAEAGQLQQRPAPRKGGMFQRDDLQIIDEIPQFKKVVRGWDLASSKDKRAAYTVGLKMGLTYDSRIVIIDVQRGRWTPHEVETNMLATASLDGYDVEQSFPQDPGQAGKAQVFAITKKLLGYNAHHSTETGSKEDRARPLAAQAEGGNLFLIKASWNDAFINEASLFPAGEFMDQVDAASRAFMRLISKREVSLGVVPKIIDRSVNAA